MAWTESHGGYWVVSGHRDIREIARNDALFSADHDPRGERKGYSGMTIPRAFPVTLGFLERDAPEHTVMRKALTPWFSVKSVDQWRATVEAMATAFIDEIIERGECELMEDIASPIPTILTMMLVGAPLDRWKIWSNAFHGPVAFAPGTPERDAADADAMTIFGEVAELIAARRRHPEAGKPTNLISFLCQMERDGNLLTQEEIFEHCVLLASGGIDTTAAATATTLKWLSKNPEQRDYISTCTQDEMRVAVEEFLRLFAPVPALAGEESQPACLVRTRSPPVHRCTLRADGDSSSCS